MHLVIAMLLLLSPADLVPVSAPADEADQPRVSTNQQRPGTVQADLIYSPTPIDPDAGTGAQTCLKKHKCSAGTWCATGECQFQETARGCAWCTASKCKGMTLCS